MIALVDRTWIIYIYHWFSVKFFSGREKPNFSHFVVAYIYFFSRVYGDAPLRSWAIIFKFEHKGFAILFIVLKPFHFFENLMNSSCIIFCVKTTKIIIGLVVTLRLGGRKTVRRDADKYFHFVIAHYYFMVSRGTPGDGRRNPSVPRNPGWESLF